MRDIALRWVAYEFWWRLALGTVGLVAIAAVVACRIIGARPGGRKAG
ncbi:unnamed protein product [uncultured bacterium]|nr:unnamed protein product [uncultured bacterium]